MKIRLTYYWLVFSGLLWQIVASARPIWTKDEVLSIWIHSVDVNGTTSQPSLDSHPPVPLLHFQIPYADWSHTYEKTWLWSTPEAMINGGRRFLHVCIQADQDGTDFPCLPGKQARFRTIEYWHAWNFASNYTRNGANEVQNVYHPNVTLNLVDVSGELDEANCDYCGAEFDSDGDFYRPKLFVNDFWKLAEEHRVLNASTPNVTLLLNFGWLSPFKYNIYNYKRNRQWEDFLGVNTTNPLDPKLDMLKQLLYEMNPIATLIGIIGATVHWLVDAYLVVTSFDMSALQEFDRMPAKERAKFDALPRLSLSATVWTVFQSLIACLYVMEHSHDWVGRMWVMFGFSSRLTQFLKDNFWPLAYQPEARGNEKLAKVNKELRKSKETASRHEDRNSQRIYKWATRLSLTLFFAQTLANLLYFDPISLDKPIKSLYRMILYQLYSALITYDLVMEVPQLLTNYHLKSVPYISRFALTKMLVSTFIDDLFSWASGMPTLYLLMCLRDDFIFMVTLYQMCIYPIDPTRDDYGASLDEINRQIKEDFVKKIEYYETYEGLF